MYMWNFKHFPCLKLYWQNKKNCHGGKTKKTSFARRSFWFLLRDLWSVDLNRFGLELIALLTKCWNPSLADLTKHFTLLWGFFWWLDGLLEFLLSNFPWNQYIWYLENLALTRFNQCGTCYVFCISDRGVPLLDYSFHWQGRLTDA